MTQCEMIVDYIQKHGSITPLEALRDCGCFRLASRISDLKRKGFPINIELVPFEKYNGEKSRYGKYTFADGFDKDKVCIEKGAIYYAN